MSGSAKLTEIDRNLARFLELLPGLAKTHHDKYVLMRHQQVIGYFDSAIDAQIAGNQRFDDQIFSIQQVKEAAEELGRYSYAVLSRES
jgi:hypothetical protein